ncbi:MAG TPA: ABC transporter substrate-binding protein [Desulfuromonadaceae bacterium]|jgi:putative ABC transport system substrate-binding protein
MRLISLYIAFLAVVCGIFWSPASGFAAGKVIAAVMSSDQPRYREAHRAFVKSLAALGFNSSNTEIILQAPNPDPLSWSNTVRKFNAYRPDMIVAYGAPAAQVAIKEAEGIPVMVIDFYASDQPSRGVCGVSSRVPMITLLKTIQDIHPVSRIGIIYNGQESGSKSQFNDLKKYAAQLGLKVLGANVASASAVDAALVSLQEKVDLIVATESCFVYRQLDRIISRARARNIPVVATIPDAAEKGALVSLEISPQEQGHLAADIGVRILQGARPENLSLVSPKKVDLIINMRVAKDMGVTIPFPVLGNATRILK